MLWWPGGQDFGRQERRSGRAFKAFPWEAGERRKVFAGRVRVSCAVLVQMDTAGPAFKEPAIWLERDSVASSREAMAVLRGQDIKQDCPGDRLCMAAVFLTSLNCPAEERVVCVL